MHDDRITETKFNAEPLNSVNAQRIYVTSVVENCFDNAQQQSISTCITLYTVIKVKGKGHGQITKCL